MDKVEQADQYSAAIQVRTRSARYLRGSEAVFPSTQPEPSREFLEGYEYGQAVGLDVERAERAIDIRDWIIETAHKILDTAVPQSGKDSRGVSREYRLEERLRALLADYHQACQEARTATRYQIKRVTIELVRRHGKDSWVLLRNGQIFTKKGTWRKEPLPVYQGPDFQEQTRFESLREAFRMAHVANDRPLAGSAGA